MRVLYRNETSEFITVLREHDGIPTLVVWDKRQHKEPDPHCTSCLGTGVRVGYDDDGCGYRDEYTTYCACTLVTAELAHPPSPKGGALKPTAVLNERIDKAMQRTKPISGAKKFAIWSLLIIAGAFFAVALLLGGTSSFLQATWPDVMKWATPLTISKVWLGGFICFIGAILTALLGPD